MLPICVDLQNVREPGVRRGLEADHDCRPLPDSRPVAPAERRVRGRHSTQFPGAHLFGPIVDENDAQAGDPQGRSRGPTARSWLYTGTTAQIRIISQARTGCCQS